MALVTTHPAPHDAVPIDGVYGLLPLLEILDLALLSTPAARDPAVDPFRHSLHEVLRVARERDAKVRALPREHSQRLDRAAQCHSVIGGCRIRDPIVKSTQPLGCGIEVLDHASRAARVAPFASVTQTGFIGEDRNERQGTCDVAHPTTSNPSSSSRKSVRRSPVVGLRASMLSRPALTRNSSGTTTYSVPRRYTAIRRRAATARSSRS